MPASTMDRNSAGGPIAPRETRSIKTPVKQRLRRRTTLAVISVVAAAIPGLGSANALDYQCSFPPLEVTFVVKGGYYNGAVNCGNLFLQTDIPTAPVCGGGDPIRENFIR